MSLMELSSHVSVKAITSGFSSATRSGKCTKRDELKGHVLFTNFDKGMYRLYIICNMRNFVSLRVGGGGGWPT